ncbi:MAG: tetratricopeptide repeat protein [Candidatus Azobacteroides sp.]|nr:tetratricopeptide repeat protein [Candidatus Azobacteroides sp.]
MVLKSIEGLMADPVSLNEQTLSELDALIKVYPYFQTARILHLKNLQQLNDARFSEELPKTALYAADRSRLYHYIEGVPLKPEGRTLHSQHAADDIKNRTLALIDAFLSSDDMEHQKEEVLIPAVGGPAKTEDIPLPEKMLASYDYLSFLLNSHSKIATEEEANSQPEVRLQHQELIDNFISENEEGNKITVSVPENFDIKKDPVLQKEKEEKEEFFSETLAKIYIKQKRYEKALEIIRKLYLKFPEKNIYFADQIRFLELLIENSKIT